jgi:hypothetical protein
VRLGADELRDEIETDDDTFPERMKQGTTDTYDSNHMLSETFQPLRRSAPSSTPPFRPPRTRSEQHESMTAITFDTSDGMFIYRAVGGRMEG